VRDASSGNGWPTGWNSRGAEALVSRSAYRGAVPWAGAGSSAATLPQQSNDAASESRITIEGILAFLYLGTGTK
jgi:hypothetical protein